MSEIEADLPADKAESLFALRKKIAAYLTAVFQVGSPARWETPKNQLNSQKTVQEKHNPDYY